MSSLTFKIHIPDQPALPGDRVLHSVYPHVDHRRSFLDHVRSDEVWNP